jgi:hypothetical protein
LGRYSSGVEDAKSKQAEVGTPVHLPFDKFQTVEVAFNRSVAPGQLQSSQHGILVSTLT